MAVVCEQCNWCARNLGTMNIWANIGLLAVKLLGGIVGRSHALIADAVHSLSDVIVAFLVWAGLKVSGTSRDEDHHWGHGNIEFVVSMLIGVFMLCAAVAIVAAAVMAILEGATAEPSIVALWAAAISVASNELLFRHSLCVGTQIDSPVMIANAWGNRADVYSSLAAFVGVFAAKLGFTFLDPLAAVVVALMIAQSGVSTLITGITGITDRSADSVMLAKVRRMSSEEKGIADISGAHVRKVGQKSWIYFDAKFHAETEVSEVRRIVARLRERILDEIGRDGIGEVVIISRLSEPTLAET